MLTRSQQLLRALNLGSEEDLGVNDSSSDEDLLSPLPSSLNAEANAFSPPILTPSFPSGPAPQAEAPLTVPAPQLVNLVSNSNRTNLMNIPSPQGTEIHPAPTLASASISEIAGVPSTPFSTSLEFPNYSTVSQIMTMNTVQPYKLPDPFNKSDLLRWASDCEVQQRQNSLFMPGMHLSSSILDKIKEARLRIELKFSRDKGDRFPTKVIRITTSLVQRMAFADIQKCLLAIIQSSSANAFVLILQSVNNLVVQNKNLDDFKSAASKLLGILETEFDALDKTKKEQWSELLRGIKIKLVDALPLAFVDSFRSFLAEATDSIKQRGGSSPKSDPLMLLQLAHLFCAEVSAAQLIANPQSSMKPPFTPKTPGATPAVTPNDPKARAAAAELAAKKVSDLSLAELSKMCFNCGDRQWKTGHPKCPVKDGVVLPAGAALKARFVALKNSGRQPKAMGAMSRVNPASLVASRSDMGMLLTTHSTDLPALVRIAGMPAPITPPPIIKYAWDQPISIVGPANSTPGEARFDTGALDSNWISRSFAVQAGLKFHEMDEMDFSSPLFETPFKSVAGVTFKVHFANMGFTVSNCSCRLLDHPPEGIDVVFCREFIEEHQLLSYLTNPEQYCKVDPPPEAPEDSLDNFQGSFHSLPASILLVDEPVLEEDPRPFEDCVHKEFPLRKEAIALLERFKDSVLVSKLQDSTITGIPDFNVPLEKPFYGVPPRRLPDAKRIFLDGWIDRMLEAKIIRPSSSRTLSPLLLVNKSGPDAYRVTQDVSVLNKHFAQIQAQLPVTRDKIMAMGGHPFYFSFDLIHCYFQFRVSPEMCSLYAFSTHRGVFEWNGVLPQGDRNAPAWSTMQLQFLFGDLSDFLSFYFDDFAGFSNTPEEHLLHAEIFLQRCLEHNIKVGISKIKLGFPEIQSLGFILNKSGYAPLDSQREKFLAAPFPTREQLRCWFGLLNTFRDFIPNLNELESAFSAVRKKGAVYQITPEMRIAFNKARQAVADIKMLHFPIPGKTLYLDTDAATTGCGSCLYHEDEDGRRQIIRWLSHVFSTAALKWETIGQECYGIIHALNGLEPLLLGQNFVIRTDHRNLLWMEHSVNARVQRWFGYIFRFSFTIEHIPGKDNIVADALSRIFASPSPLSMGGFVPGFQMGPSDDEDEDRLLLAEEAMEMAISPNTHVWTEEALQLLFNRFHNGTSGHSSLSETLELMRVHCPISDLRHIVTRMCAACATCAKSRPARALKKRQLQQLARHSTSAFKPFEKIQMDFLTGLPTSARGFSVILVFVDTFSKFCLLYPTYDETANSVLSGLLWVHGLFGSPSSFASDGAPAFISVGVSQFCKVLGIKHFITAPYQPTAHGIVERLNREIIRRAQQCFMDIAEANSTNWEIFIPLVNKVLNSRIHSTTGVAPAAMLFGSDLSQRLGFATPPSLDQSGFSDPVQFIRSLDNSLMVLYRNGLASTEDGIIANFLAAPESLLKFDIGTYVLLLNERSSTRKLGKLSPSFVGPLRVVRPLAGDFYELADLVQDQKIFAHAQNIACFNGCSSDAEAISIACSDHNEFEVISIESHVFLGDAAKTSSLYFNVTWADGSQSQTAFRHCLHLGVAKDYVEIHKKDLAAAWSAIAAAATRTDNPTRVRKANALLADYVV